MSDPDKDLQDLARAHGVQTGFHDLGGTHHAASPDTLRALLAAQGIGTATAREIAGELARAHASTLDRILPEEQILQVGQAATLPTGAPCDWVLLDEGGSEVAAGRAEDTIALPSLPVGYYRLIATTGRDRQRMRLLVRPATAPDLPGRTGQPRIWGLTGALYGLRSRQNGGLGNYADLAEAAQGLGQAGAGFLGLNPIHALGWAAEDMISPYSPTHRGHFNGDHVATARGLGPTPEAALIDYPAFRQRHRTALQVEYARSPRSDAFERWRNAQGPDLADFARFEALSETHGPDFRRWPADLRHPGSAAATEAGPRADFHAWLQWRAETQIAAAQRAARGAGMALGLYLDLAVGARPGGAEAWMNAGTIAQGVTIGAPPDHLSPRGQSWALAAHAPGPLARAFYAPLRAMLARLMAHAGMLRIDHALGLLRSYWLPDDGSPGGYVGQPFEALLAVIAIEAQRAGCVIVGEDLGLVPDGFRERLNRAGLYSYSVWQYLADQGGDLPPPEALPARALACFATHDTPTLQGFWHGTDVGWWQRVGWIGPETAHARHGHRARQRHSLRGHCGLAPDAPAQAIADGIHRTLARAPSALLAIQLDDALGLDEAQNLPGTINEHPNWRRRLPLAVEEMASDASLRGLEGLMPPDRHRPRTDIKTA